MDSIVPAQNNDLQYILTSTTCVHRVLKLIATSINSVKGVPWSYSFLRIRTSGSCRHLTSTSFASAHLKRLYTTDGHMATLVMWQIVGQCALLWLTFYHATIYNLTGVLKTRVFWLLLCLASRSQHSTCLLSSTYSVPEWPRTLSGESNIYLKTAAMPRRAVVF